MKKSDFDGSFREPTRQSAVAILLIILKTYRILVRQAWPILLIFIFNGKSSSRTNQFLIGIAIFAVGGMIYSIINYFRYYFYIDEDELVVESGVFRRSKMNVPFDRIQTINFEQNIIHRIFNVVRLKIDTAGSAKAEFQFHAIAQDKADGLRNLLLSKRKSAKKSIVSDPLFEEATAEVETYTPIMQLDLGDLIKAGAVENHLRSGGIIIAFMWWIWQTVEDSGMVDVQETVEGTVASQISSSVTIAGILIVLFFLFSFIVSMVKMVITNYDLKFLRSSTGFKINAGLFTKKDTSALDHKIQVVSWGDNPLKKLIGIKDLRLKQASSVVLNKQTSIKVPSCKMTHIDQVTETLYGEAAFDNIDYAAIDKRYFYRNGGILTLIFSVIVTFLVYLELYPQAIILGIIAVLVVLSFYLSYRKKRYGYNQEMLVIHGGTYGNKTEVMPIYKIQSVSRHQSPYQRRNGLANLTVHTASGKVGIPYISDQIARDIMDDFLYKIEVDRRKWM